VTYSIHENYSRDETASLGSDRSFGLVMAAAFSVFTLLSVLHHGRAWPVMAIIAMLFAAAAVVVPAALNPLNRAWLKFGLLLHKLISPIIMGLVFYGAVLPTGLVMRARGKDLLRLKFEPEADSYWIARRPPGPAPESMKDQF
jgi:hypothetical protein